MSFSVLKSIHLALFAFSITFLAVACKPKHEKFSKNINPKAVEEPLMEFNKSMIAIEDKQIDDYLNRRGWNMIRCKSGLRYLIYKNGVGLNPKVGEIVVLDYSIQLIRGEEVYNSKKDGLKQFKVDQSDEITGLHELVKNLKVGDQAKAIIPSYLAYGLIGDEKRIPKKASLIYDLRLREIR